MSNAADTFNTVVLPENTEIRELTSLEETSQAFAVMHELRPHLVESEFAERVESMRQGSGYRLFALLVDRQIVALAGVAVQDNLYQGKHVWVYDLVTASQHRSQGHGQCLLTFLEGFARDNDCKSIGLVSGTQRTDAHRFYEEHMGYQRRCYQFEKAV